MPSSGSSSTETPTAPCRSTIPRRRTAPNSSPVLDTVAAGLLHVLRRVGSRTIAVDPMARGVAPRFWGGIISMPLLAALFSTLGIFGAYLVGVKLIGIDAGAFWGNMQAGVDFRYDIVNGVIKSIVFGVAVSLI